MAQLGKILVGVGIGLALLGLLLWVSPKIPGLQRLGKLPGDIHVQKEGFSFHFPWVTCLALSAAVSFGLYLFQKFFR